MDASTRFWDRNAARYARRAIADPVAYQRKLAVTGQYLHRHMDVLEIGCGTGGTARFHAPRVHRYLATDISPAMIRIARARLAEQTAAGLTFQVASMESFQGQCGTFDAVLGLSLLHLLPDLQAAVAQVFTMLKPGGVFISNTVCMKDTRAWLRPVLGLARCAGLAPPVTFLSRRELKCCLRDCGFELRHCWMPATTPDVVFLVAKKPNKSSEKGKEHR